MLSVLEKRSLAVRGLEIARKALRLKAATSGRLRSKLLCKAVHEKQVDQTIKSIEDAMRPMFEAQIASAKKKLAAQSNEKAATVSVKSVFNLDEWQTELIDRAAPVIALAMCRGAAAQLKVMGIDLKKVRKSVELELKASIPRNEKASTASDWLDNFSDDDWDSDDLSDVVFSTPYGSVNLSIATEFPAWMKKKLSEHIDETFEQDYWQKINETTRDDIQGYLDKGLRDGWSIRDMADRISETLGGGRYADWRAKNIARTESGHALNAGRTVAADGLIDEMTDYGLDLKKVWLSVLGTTTRAEHANLDGVPANKQNRWVLAGVSVRWPGDVVLPPAQRCNCFPAGVLVSGDFTGAQRGWYEGRLTELITSSGVRLTVTPNHPIMTPKGWVSAGQLNPGDQVVCNRPKSNNFSSASAGVDVSGIVGFEGENIERKPAPIGQVFGAFYAMSISIEVVSPKMDDFYGDGKFLYGDIEIVRANWKLLEDGESDLFEKRGDFVFVLSSDSGGISDELSDSPLMESGVRIGSPATTVPCRPKPIEDVFFGSITPTGALTIGIAADWNSQFPKASTQHASTDSELFAQALQGNAGLIEVDNLVDVRNVDFSGHVYDLQSEAGVIVACNPNSCNTDIGIVASNCQCSIVIDFGVDEEMSRRLISDYEARLAEDEKNYVLSKEYRGNRIVLDALKNCGTGAGGFKPGNTCKRGGVSAIEDKIVGEGLAESATLSGMGEKEAIAVYDGLKKSLSVDGKQLYLRSVQLVDGLPVGGDQGGLGYGAGHVYITKKFLENAKNSSPESVRRDLEGTGGERNFGWQDGKNVSERIQIAVAHEVGHHVENGSLFLDMGKAVRNSGVSWTEDDAVKVSGYASTHNAELFAELHAFKSIGRWDKIPSNLQTLYSETLKTADPDPLFVRKPTPV